MKLRRESPNAERQVWNYVGTSMHDGVKYYVWERFLQCPKPGSKYTSFVYTQDVHTFWRAKPCPKSGDDH